MDTVKRTKNFAETEGQSWMEQKPTVEMRPCRVCAAEMCDHDKFCRHCGARQTGEIPPPQMTTAPSSVYATSRLQADTFRSISASLLTGITAGALAGVAQLNSRFGRRLVSVLIAVPLWLMLMLLSPFDAYATAKAIAGQHQTSY
jgi:hypothetical protein